LKRQASQAVGIAFSADRQRRFPSSQEEIFCGKTMVFPRADGQMIDEWTGRDFLSEI
jgi:uracil DNA glycosylase